MVETKAVIFTAGRGTRLQPLTYITTKCLIPVFDRPMVVSPLETLDSLGIKDICVVTNKKSLEDMKKVMSHYAKPETKITYRLQKEPLGTADALSKAKGFFGKKKVVVIFGDNIYDHITVPAGAFTDDFAYITITKSKTPALFGVVELDSAGNVTNIEEKPAKPKTDIVATGFDIYPNDVWEHIKSLKPSQNGELVLAGVRNIYLQKSKLRVIKAEGNWTDAGNVPALLEATMNRAKKLGWK